MTDPGAQRIDKWLWFARFAKTRMLAQQLARSGRIRVNRVRSESVSRPVRIGDALTISSPRGIRVIKVAAIGVRRGPAAEARGLYEEIMSAPVLAADPAGTAPSSPRPDKRGRRLLRHLKQDGGLPAETEQPRPSDAPHLAVDWDSH